MAGLVNYGSSDENDDPKDEISSIDVSLLQRSGYQNLSTDNTDHRRTGQSQALEPQTGLRVVRKISALLGHED